MPCSSAFLSKSKERVSPREPSRAGLCWSVGGSRSKAKRRGGAEPPGEQYLDAQAASIQSGRLGVSRGLVSFPSAKRHSAGEIRDERANTAGDPVPEGTALPRDNMMFWPLVAPRLGVFSVGMSQGRKALREAKKEKGPEPKAKRRPQSSFRRKTDRERSSPLTLGRRQDGCGRVRVRGPTGWKMVQKGVSGLRRQKTTL